LSGQESDHIPVVLGDSVPNRWALTHYFHQHRLRIGATYTLRRVVHRLANVYDQDLCLGNFKTLIVMSRFAQREHLKIRKTSKRIRVIYPGLPDRGIRLPTADNSVRFLFAGVWFERKGGLIVWEAYRRLRERFGRKVRLTILGPLPNKLKMKNEKLKVLGIQQHDFVPYERLVGEFYPNADVLVHVPPKSEGYGLVVSEAMSFGICPVVSAVGALPEMVIHGKTGVVVKPGIVESLEKALTVLVRNGALRERLGRAARARFLQEFILEKMQKELIEVYQQALSSQLQ
jgi:glycosyltransferase involved in cell wall biosynthesis